MSITYGPQAAIESVSRFFRTAIERARATAEVLDPRHANRLAGSVQIQAALNTYFGVAYPLANDQDRQFVQRLSTVYYAMNACLNTWSTVYVEYLGRFDHDATEYAYVLPPVVYPNATGDVDGTNGNSFGATWADVQANIDNIRTEFHVGGNRYVPARDLGFRINLNLNFRNADPDIKAVTVLHEMSHSLADTVDEIGGVDYYADTFNEARLLRGTVGNDDARRLADCWGFFAMDW